MFFFPHSFSSIYIYMYIYFFPKERDGFMHGLWHYLQGFDTSSRYLVGLDSLHPSSHGKLSCWAVLLVEIACSVFGSFCFFKVVRLIE